VLKKKKKGAELGKGSSQEKSLSRTRREELGKGGTVQAEKGEKKMGSNIPAKRKFEQTFFKEGRNAGGNLSQKKRETKEKKKKERKKKGKSR